MSVLILSKKPLEELENKEMLMTAQSHTSVVLTKLLLQERYHVHMRLTTGNVEETLQTGRRPDAVLTIGDEALRLRRHGDYPCVTDLACAWREWTGRPFVFAVWVISREACAAKAFQGDPTELLRTSRDYGMQHLKDVIASVQGKTPLHADELLYYYEHALDYSLKDKELEGLTLFYEKIAKAGLVQECPVIDFYNPETIV